MAARPRPGGVGARPIGLAAVDAKDLRDLVRFDEVGPRHEALFESEHLWSEIVCLEHNQALGTIEDRDSDALVLVVTGRVVDAVGLPFPLFGSGLGASIPSFGVAFALTLLLPRRATR